MAGLATQSYLCFALDRGKGVQCRTVGDYATPGPVPSVTLPGLVMEWEEVWAE